MSHLPYLEPDKLSRYCGALFRIFLYIFVGFFLVLQHNYMNSDNRCYHSIFTCSNETLTREARTNIGALDRAQQAYFLDVGKFGETMEKIGMGIPTETPIYSYRIVQLMTPVADWKQGHSANWVMSIAQPKGKGLSSYLGLVWLEIDPNTKETTTRAVLCESYATKNEPLPTRWYSPPMPKMIYGKMQCPMGYEDLGS